MANALHNIICLEAEWEYRNNKRNKFRLNPSLTFNYPFFLLSSTLRFSFAVLCTTNFSRF